MPDFTQRPDNAFLDSAVTYYRDIWSLAHSNWEKWDSFYHRTFSLWDKVADASKGKRSIYRPSTPTSIIDIAADSQFAFSPRMHRDPVGTGKTAKKDADDIEGALKDVFDNGMRHETYLPWKQASRHMLQYGYAIIEAPVMDLRGRVKPPKPIDGESREDFKGRESRYRAHKQGWNPMRFRAPNPGHVLLDPEEKESQIAIKFSTQIASELWEESRQKKRTRSRAELLDMSKRKPWEKVKRQDIWSRWWHAVRATGEEAGSSPSSGQILWIEKNVRGFVPFLHGFAGFGMEPSNLDKTDPSFLASGLLAPILESLKVEAQSATAGHELWLNTVYGAIVTSDDPFEMVKQMNAGAPVIHGDVSNMGRLPVAQYDRSLQEIDRAVRADIEKGSFASDLAGVRQEGVSTVGQQRILSSAAQKKFIAPKVQMEDLASLAGSRVLELVDTVSILDGQVRGLRKSQINGNYDVNVTFEVTDPVLDLRRKQFGLQEMAAGVKDIRTYLEEDARVENVSKRLKQLMEDSVRNHPSVTNAFALETARGMGLEAEFDPEFEEGGEAPMPAVSPNGASQFSGEPTTEAEAISDMGDIQRESNPQLIEGV
jgi:hypothetical protein